MRLETRQEQILNFIVRNYIANALPISSGLLSEEGILDVSPATIRNNMLTLDEKGFLTQPHTSAGRIPTEKGYHYFVEYLMKTETPTPRVCRQVKEHINKGGDVFDEIATLLAHQMRLFTTVASIDRQHVISRGLADVLQEPEFLNHTQAIAFADMIEELPGHIAELYEQEISPDITIKEFGMVSARFDHPKWGKGVVVTMGPQRMNYEEVGSLLQYVVHALEE